LHQEKINQTVQRDLRVGFGVAGLVHDQAHGLTEPPHHRIVLAAQKNMVWKG